MKLLKMRTYHGPRGKLYRDLCQIHVVFASIMTEMFLKANYMYMGSSAVLPPKTAKFVSVN